MTDIVQRPDTTPWSGLTVALYLTFLVILAGLNVLRTKGAWCIVLWRMGHSGWAPPRRGTADDSQWANLDPARRTISQFYTCSTRGLQSSCSSTRFIPFWLGKIRDRKQVLLVGLIILTKSLVHYF